MFDELRKMIILVTAVCLLGRNAEAARPDDVAPDAAENREKATQALLDPENM
jgi:hypothetical protein